MKATTSKEYEEALNKAIDYINLNLQEPITLKEVAAVSCISEFHFHRIFKAYIGESLGAYISRLRLESVAQKLQISQNTLNEITEQTAYQSPQSLSKAFRNQFGIPPIAFKNVHKYFSAQLTTPNAINIKLKPRIKNVGEKNLIYIRIISTYGEEIAYKKAWDKLCSYAVQKELLNSSTEFIGLSFDNPNITKHEQCRFYACLTVPASIKAKGTIGNYTLDGGTFAIFTLQGSYIQLRKLYPYIYFEWLPKSKYELRDAMPFEKYVNSPDEVKEKDLITEIYIPIKETKL